jgi:hypothetical protein
VLEYTGGTEHVIASSGSATFSNLRNMNSSTLNLSNMESNPTEPFSKLTITPINGEKNNEPRRDACGAVSATVDLSQNPTFHASKILGKRSRTVTDIGRTVDDLSTTDEESQFPEDEDEKFLRDLGSSQLATNTNSPRATKAGDNDTATKASAVIEQTVTGLQKSSLNPMAFEPTPHFTAPPKATKDEGKLATPFAVDNPHNPTAMEAKLCQKTVAPFPLPWPLPLACAG